LSLKDLRKGELSPCPSLPPSLASLLTLSGDATCNAIGCSRVEGADGGMEEERERASDPAHPEIFLLRQAPAGHGFAMSLESCEVRACVSVCCWSNRDRLGTFGQVDIWATGVVIHWMLTDLMPWAPQEQSQVTAGRPLRACPPLFISSRHAERPGGQR
jgi:hypothetical protein